MNQQTAPVEKDKGFTLIELLVVVVIIGVLAAIAIPLFLNQKDKAAEAGVKSDIKNASTYLESFFVDKATYVGGQAFLDDKTATGPGFKASKGTVVTVKNATIKDYCIEGVGTTGKTFKLLSADNVVVEGSC